MDHEKVQHNKNGRTKQGIYAKTEKVHTGEQMHSNANLDCDTAEIRPKERKEHSLKCDLCDYRSTRIGHLQIHMNKHSLKCDLCDYETLVESEFFRHQRVHTDKQVHSITNASNNKGSLQTHMNYFICDECDYKTLVEMEFLEHEKVHTDKQVHSITNSSSNKSPLQTHMNKHSLKCDLCDYRSTRIGHLQTHMNKHSLKCDECNYKTMVESEFLDHQRVHTDKQVHSITNASSNKGSLQAHMNYFICDECDYTTSVEMDFSEHEKEHKGKPVLSDVNLPKHKSRKIEEKKFKCDLCDYRSTRIGHLQTHMNKHSLKCDECNYKTMVESEFLDHQRVHTDEQVHSITNSSSNKSTSQTHMNYFICDECDYTTSVEMDFLEHEKEHKGKPAPSDVNLPKHKSRKIEEKKFKCDLCDYRSTRIGHLQIHMNKHSLKCDECDYETLVESEFFRHQRVHTDKQVHSITNASSNKGSLQTHMNYFICDECDYTTSVEMDFLEHEKEHKGKPAPSDVNLPKHKSRKIEEKKFKCDLCDYRSTRIGHLQTHMNKHSLKCDECDYKTLVESEFLDHQRVHTDEQVHSITNSSSNKSPSQTHMNYFICDECDYTTSVEMDFSEHEKEHKGKPAPSDVNLPKHKSRKIEEKKFKCDLCDYRSTRIGHLQTHMNKHSLKCDECTTRLGRSEFLDHKEYTLTTSHSITIISNKVLQTHMNYFICDECDYTTSTRIGHLQTHMNKHSLKCDECNYKTMVESDFLDHKRVHTDKQVHSITNASSNKGSLQAHMNYFICDECDYTTSVEMDFWNTKKNKRKTSASDVNLPKHKSRKIEEKKFKCELVQDLSEVLESGSICKLI
ncbi:hypothetical protein FQR65_LT03522 [Abscondita terminalis]|nr:hypothetical protein FQR65_LT03522 [Abscondita terminalis]